MFKCFARALFLSFLKSDWEEAELRHVDFLSIDAEGYDALILQGVPLRDRL